MTIAPPIRRATIADLEKVEGKAELIDGKVVRYMATGFRPNKVAGRVFRKLADHVDNIGIGEVFTDNMGFAVPKLPSGRESFSPDVSYYSGPLPANPMKFVNGPPDFAVEIRSENDYGLAAERVMAAKREDYFLAGTKVVWDVDTVNNWIRKYLWTSPNQSTQFDIGSLADATPVLADWQIAVANIMS